MTEPYHLEIKIPGLPPTPNIRMHWAQKMKDTKRWRELVTLLVGVKKPEKPLDVAKLTLTRVSTKAPDYDNLVSSFKPVIDGLISAGVLKDDKFTLQVNPTYRHQTCGPKDGHILVKVEGV